MSDSLFRQWAMLRMIPRQPKKISVKQLLQKLQNQGYSTTERTIQRDLPKLSAIFCLVSDEANPAGWSFSADSGMHDLPALTPSAALTFKLAHQFLQPLIPPKMLCELTPYMDQAGKVLTHCENSNLKRWTDLVRVVPRTQPLIPADVDETAASAIYDALLQGRRLQALYTPVNGDGREYEINPLGLVFRDSAAYLVCTLWDYQDVKQFALHRFQFAVVLDKSRSALDGFDLDEYIASGAFDWPQGDGQPIALEALLSPRIAFHLSETPVSEDQQLMPQPDGRVLLRATVSDTLQLRRWLIGYGTNVEVLKPLVLREDIASQVKKMAAFYLDSGVEPGNE